jgi:UDP-glucuronate 4-epimerase
MKNFLITGGAGFIGSNLIDKLLLTSNDLNIICVDNFDPYYSGIIKEKNIQKHKNFLNYNLYKIDISDYNSLKKIFECHNIDIVVHLAARAGVRPSLEMPRKYMETNITGTVNLLELCREFNVKKFIFGSSSSVYGSRKDGPFREDMKIDKPISPYAATKASGEQICYTYSHLFGINIVCLRFFTVYGPRQRPDLAIHKFSRLISEEMPIPVYGDGTTVRDYTYIDDILQGIIASINYNENTFDVFNLGESRTVSLKYLVELLEDNLKKKAVINYLPMQPGDVPMTFADISKSKEWLNYNPTTLIAEGIQKFIEWFKLNYELV